MAQVDSAAGYAGDLLPDAAWALLERQPMAQLVDVRTTAEWNFVGQPDLSSLGRTAHLVEWQNFPSMALNPEFVASAAHHLEASGAGKETPLVLLCRSGARSRAAAIALTKAGYAQAFNIAGGFEGDANAAGHRGVTNGWKAAGLPWRQG
ncbi:MAG TPA: rhodanese-like domain-containing protein [Rhizomicrobium sp.]|jgi:rhodanese-related sulfurtransferase|nr:rhodanese-like domain-containing protein [Rhizomicrobium sp.]